MKLSSPGSRFRRWLGAGCTLAVLCGLAAPRSASAQDSASTPSATKAAAKRQTKTASKKSTLRKSSSAAKSRSKSTASSARDASSKHSASRKSSTRKKTARGQQKIDSERAQSIQEALIREHYLSGEAAGTWNQASEDAMRRYQADHGWQSKTVPDSRALISLGLGPSHDNLLNPESAMTTGPATTRAASLSPVSHSADPGAHINNNPAPLTEPAASASSDRNAPSPR